VSFVPRQNSVRHHLGIAIRHQIGTLIGIAANTAKASLSVLEATF